MKKVDRLVQSFSSFKNACEIWYNRRMANKNTSKTRRGDRLKQNSKKEAIQRMLISLGIALLLIFRNLQIRGCRYNPYNLIRLLVGSLTYLAIIGILLYLFFSSGYENRKASHLAFHYICRLTLDFWGLLGLEIWFGQVRSKRNHGSGCDGFDWFSNDQFCWRWLDWGCSLYSNCLSLFKYRHLLYWFYLDFSRRSLISPWSVYDIAEFSVEALPNGEKGMSVEKRNALSNKKKKLAKRLRKRLD